MEISTRRNGRLRGALRIIAIALAFTSVSATLAWAQGERGRGGHGGYYDQRDDHRWHHNERYHRNYIYEHPRGYYYAPPPVYYVQPPPPPPGIEFIFPLHIR